MTKRPYKTTYHRDGTITVWNVYTQQWERTSRPSDRVLSSLDQRDRDRAIRHCKIPA
jgi:hypothetical protein